MSDEKNNLPVVPVEVIKSVQASAISRYQAGAIISEADFFAGAMAAFVAVYGDVPGAIPAPWVVQIMSGRGLIESLLERAKEEKKEPNSEGDARC